MKIRLLLPLLFSFSAHVLAATESSGETNKLIGFDCASEIIDVLPLLGRGEDFPAFLAQDIDTELKRQDPGSDVQSIECTGEPKLQGATIMVSENGEERQALDKLAVTFPLLINLHNGNSKIELTVEHQYFAENLATELAPKTTQNFNVINQQ